jgi:fructoselysine 6-phosphate deglycase
MTQQFDRKKVVESLSTAMREKDEAAKLGSELGRRGFNKLFLVGCGAPNRAMSILEYWLKRYARRVEVRRYFPAELVHQDPEAIDEGTLVLLGSHSGTTKETVQSAAYLKGKPCTTVCITQRPDSPLAREVQHPLTYGVCEHGYYPFNIMAQAFASGFFSEADDWPLHGPIMSSLGALPSAIADAVEASEEKVAEDAQKLRDDRFLLVVGAGPMFSAAYIFGVCVLMESQWMHAYPALAAEFFHGPFEVVDSSTPVVVLVGEDPGRPEAERAVGFCERFTDRLTVYDSMDFEMRGVHRDVRGVFAPIVVEAVLYRMAEHLAELHGQPLSTRRYMGKKEY